MIVLQVLQASKDLSDKGINNATTIKGTDEFEYNLKTEIPYKNYVPLINKPSFLVWRASILMR